MIDQFPFKPKINKISRSLSSKRKSKTYVFQKLYEEDKYKNDERDRIYIRNQMFQKLRDILQCTFRPNIKRSKYLNKWNSKTTGDFYERSIHWKQNQQKWIENQRKLKEEKMQKEIVDNHVETKRYSKRAFLNTTKDINEQIT